MDLWKVGFAALLIACIASVVVWYEGYYNPKLVERGADATVKLEAMGGPMRNAMGLDDATPTQNREAWADWTNVGDGNPYADALFLAWAWSGIFFGFGVIKGLNGA